MKKKAKANLGYVEENDGMGFLMGTACFLFPPVGAYQYLVHKDEKPRRARIGGGLALMSTLGSIVSYQMKKNLKKGNG